jgi:CRP-like cAMP-binding protein
MGNFNFYEDKLDLNFWYELCTREGKLCHYKRGEYFVRCGEITHYMGLVKQGYLKYNTIDSEGNEHISGFAFSNTLVGDYLSATHQMPCLTNIIAATDAEVWVCSCEVLNRVFNEDTRLHQMIADSLFHQVYSLYLDMHRSSPKERYVALLKRCPEILQNITLKEVASYLNMTPTYLSRIRKEITFENK